MSSSAGEHGSPLFPRSPPESPAASPAESDPATSPGMTAVTDFAIPASPASPPASLRLPVARSTSDNMTTSLSPLGPVSAARRPPPPVPRSSALPADMQAKMKAFHLSRQGPAKPSVPSSPASAGPGPIPSGALGGGFTGSAMGGGGMGNPGGLRLPPGVRPQPTAANSAPAVPSLRPGGIGGGLAAKRGMKAGLKLSDAQGAPPPAAPGATDQQQPAKKEDAFSKYSSIVDISTGTLNFKGKATIHGSGIDFSSGSSFNISLDEVDTLDELGKGNYGTVYKVRHSRPRIRKPGMGLAGNKAPPGLAVSGSPTSATYGDAISKGQRNTTGLIMAMKELRLELDDAKFAAIIMELDILHKCASPFIVDFYGAFFQEGAVYICMEFMDGGSVDKLYGDGVPENVLKKIALSTVLGLKDLKETHNIIHRDVKPTNILVNSRGQVKICDFGVSGNLVASIAKTNIGCQSYMAPERISSGGVAQAGANPGGGTYSVQSDIWSLGLTVIECAMGRYPYPPETYNNIFSQLEAIVNGEPPDLPGEGYSDLARNFVKSCLRKDANLRPDYARLARDPWLMPLFKPPTISEDAEAEAEAEAGADAATTCNTVPASMGANSSPTDTADEEVATWVKAQIEKRKAGTLKGAQPPALHTAPLDSNPISGPNGTPTLDGA